MSLELAWMHSKPCGGPGGMQASAQRFVRMSAVTNGLAHGHGAATRPQLVLGFEVSALIIGLCRLTPSALTLPSLVMPGGCFYNQVRSCEG